MHAKINTWSDSYLTAIAEKQKCDEIKLRIIEHLLTYVIYLLVYPSKKA